MTATEARHRRNFLKTLDRGLRVLRAFTPERPTLTLSELARLLDLEPATALRFAYTLEHLGYLRRGAGGAYGLTEQARELGRAAQPGPDLRAAARPCMEALAREVEETVSLAVRDGAEIVVIEQVESPRPVTVRRRLGERQPAHATAQGKVLLAGLPPEERAALVGTMRLTAYSPRTITERPALLRELQRTQQRGYAVNNNEMDAGLRAVATPIEWPPGQVRAALSVDVPVGRMTLAQMQAELLGPLREAAADIARALGG